VIEVSAIFVAITAFLKLGGVNSNAYNCTSGDNAEYNGLILSPIVSFGNSSIRSLRICIASSISS
jgi:hypothetical protein